MMLAVSVFLVSAFCNAGIVDIPASNKTPAYRITEEKLVNGNNARRTAVWATVSSGLSKDQVTAVIQDLVKRNSASHAISISISEHGEAPGAYSVGMGIWAPGGDWSRANEGKQDWERKTYKLKTEFREAYFSAGKSQHWSAAYGLTKEKALKILSDIDSACMDASNAVFAKYPTGNVSLEEQMRAAALTRVAQSYGVTSTQAVEMQDKRLEEIYGK